MQKISDLIRIKFKEGDDIRDAGLGTPEDIVRYDNIVYGTKSEWQVLDVYRPRNTEGQYLPVIISVHGGAWVYGDKERYQYYCMSLAQRGFAVVNYSYRLAPEFKFPAAIEDTKQVFEWVLKNRDTYFFDEEYIFGVGDSAGAMNLAVYSAICTNPDYAEQYDFPLFRGVVPKAIALNCGVYRIELDSETHTTELLRELMPMGGTKTEMEKMEVLDYISSSFPPAFIMTAVDDFLRDQSLLIVEKLMEHKVPFVFRVYGDVKTSLAHVFHCNVKSESARLCNDEECEFFQRMYLKS